MLNAENKKTKNTNGNALFWKQIQMAETYKSFSKHCSLAFGSGERVCNDSTDIIISSEHAVTSTDDNRLNYSWSVLSNMELSRIEKLNVLLNWMNMGHDLPHINFRHSFVLCILLVGHLSYWCLEWNWCRCECGSSKTLNNISKLATWPYFNFNDYLNQFYLVVLPELRSNYSGF